MDDVDPDALKQFSFTVFSKLEGAVTSAMIHLGDQLGLYRALRDATPTPLSSDGLAAATGLHERWVREWAYNQASAGIVSCDDDERFSLSPEAAAVLATPEHPAFAMGMFHRFPQTMEAVGEMPESFRTGIGHDYDSHGPEGAVGIERSFEPWNRTFLIPTVLPALDGVVERLESGEKVADVGCGAGGALLLMAQRFPDSEFHGYDISRHALERAEQRRRERGLHNVELHDAAVDPLPADHSFGFVTTFDCIHDMTHPAQVIAALRAALTDDGTWLLADIKAHETFEANARRNPMAPLMYGISVLSCMSSAMSTPDGAGLGTLGLSEATATAMARDAGFTRFERLPIEHATNWFFQVRP